MVAMEKTVDNASVILDALDMLLARGLLNRCVLYPFQDTLLSQSVTVQYTPFGF